MAYLDIDNLQSIFLDDDTLRARHLQRESCGTLNITSGRIVACDPLVQPQREPFVRSVSGRGAFPVEVLHSGGRHALAVLWLRERGDLQASDLRWEAALLDGQSQDELGSDEFYGYPVDAGVGCFMDVDGAKAMAEREARESANPEYISYFDDVLDAEMGESGRANHYPLGAGSANNIVTFSAGWGDGSYPSFWALDAVGAPVALVTDFMTMQGGDARDEDDKRSDAYLASLSPEKLAALEALGAAAIAGDAVAIQPLLDDGLAQANEIVPSLGETAITSAIRMNQLDALRLLLAAVQGLPMPPRFYRMDEDESYIDYARKLKKPRVDGLIALLEKAAAPAAPAPRPGFLKRLFS
ncbi:DUF4241 domain-containing protein [Acidovorax cavernicola]|uniref:DUF4241 domain-containing protein n=1 Tax=Acidovorax cavernicola TaxID=1675792 RepID=A0A9X8D7V0_9BURK|nr:DUF4241 domain-containing protein [Acidovorax cavernicola]RIX83660.1 DUF4241 domain-containing protein [Acidovorax cavernicola]